MELHMDLRTIHGMHSELKHGKLSRSSGRTSVTQVVGVSSSVKAIAESTEGSQEQKT